MQNYEYFKTKTINPEPQIIASVKQYYAYKEGEVRIFHSLASAHKFSLLTELIVSNLAEVDAAVELHRAWEGEVHALWYAALRAEFPEVNIGVFRECYAAANERASWRDDFINELEFLVPFAIRIMEL